MAGGLLRPQPPPGLSSTVNVRIYLSAVAQTFDTVNKYEAMRKTTLDLLSHAPSDRLPKEPQQALASESHGEDERQQQWHRDNSIQNAICV